jgi:hypothetical protein
MGLVSIAANPRDFVDEIERSIRLRGDERRLKRVDEFLADKSWDATFDEMLQILRKSGEKWRTTRAQADLDEPEWA